MTNDSGRSAITAAQERLGDAVRERRKRYGWTQQELAERATEAGLSYQQGTVAKIESGSRPTSVGELAVLAMIFGTSAAKLLHEDESAQDYWQVWLQLRESQNRLRAAGNALGTTWGEYWRARELVRRYLTDAEGVYEDTGSEASTRNPMRRSLSMDMHSAKRALDEDPNQRLRKTNEEYGVKIQHGIDPEAS